MARTLFGLSLGALAILIAAVTIALVAGPPPCNLRFPAERLHDEFVAAAAVALAFALLAVLGPRVGARDELHASAWRAWRLLAAFLGWLSSLALVFEFVDARKPNGGVLLASPAGIALAAGIVIGTLWLLPSVLARMFVRRP